MKDELRELYDKLMAAFPEQGQRATLHTGAAKVAACIHDMMIAATAIRKRTILSKADLEEIIPVIADLHERASNGNGEQLVDWTYLERLFVETCKQAIKIAKGL